MLSGFRLRPAPLKSNYTIKPILNYYSITTHNSIRETELHNSLVVLNIKESFLTQRSWLVHLTRVMIPEIPSRSNRLHQHCLWLQENDKSSRLSYLLSFYFHKYTPAIWIRQQKSCNQLLYKNNRDMQIISSCWDGREGVAGKQQIFCTVVWEGSTTRKGVNTEELFSPL